MGLTINECGIMVEPQLGMSVDALLDAARRTEELGFGYFFRSDHILPTDDRRGLDSPECWTSLGAIAASTSRVRFGPMVSPIGFRNPALLAKMACTIHSLSQGRLQLGVGAGWYEAEYKAHGFPFPDFRTRTEQFGEALEIIAAMVGKGRADFDGKHFSAHTDCYPRPKGRMHLIVGGRTRPVVRLAARFADEWNSYRTTKLGLDGLKSLMERGPDRPPLELTQMTRYLIAENQAKLEEYARLQSRAEGESASPKEYLSQLGERGAPCGTVDGFVEQLNAISDAGFRRVYFQTFVAPRSPMVDLLADTLKTRF